MPSTWQSLTAQRTLVGAVLTAALALVAPVSQASSPQSGADRQSQIAKFNQGKFAESAALGWQIVQRDANDATALYYLSQAFVKLNRIDEARTYFTRCYHATKDATMKLYCHQSLANLANQANQPKANSGSSAVVENETTQADSSQSRASAESEKTMDPALMSRKMQILKTGADEIAYRKKILEEAVLAAKKTQAEQMEGIPQFIERRFSVSNSRPISSTYENPDYKESLERSERELKQKLTQLDEEFKRREAEITADCKRRASAYDDVDKGLASQKQGRNSQIQLHSQHTNSFVRHFVNFDGSTPVGLKTRQVAQPLQPASQPKPATVHK